MITKAASKKSIITILILLFSVLNLSCSKSNKSFISLSSFSYHSSESVEGNLVRIEKEYRSLLEIESAINNIKTDYYLLLGEDCSLIEDKVYREAYSIDGIYDTQSEEFVEIIQVNSFFTNRSNEQFPSDYKIVISLSSTAVKENSGFAYAYSKGRVDILSNGTNFATLTYDDIFEKNEIMSLLENTIVI